MDISIVIVNWNTRELLLDCLASVYATVRTLRFEVFLVDNASSDGSVEAMRMQYPQVKIIQNEKNLGFAAANNKALRVMQGKYALLLNTDTVLTEGAIANLFAYLEKHGKIGMACGQLLNADGSKQNSIANFPSLLGLLCNETVLRLLWPRRFPNKRQEYRTPIEVESCIGACLMVRKEAMEAVGLLDERYFFFMEETDWAFAMYRAGWKSCFVPDARIYHLQGQSAGHNVRARIMFYRARYQYFRKWFPQVWPLHGLLVVVRLVINVLLNGIGLVLTLGLHGGIWRRLALYLQLLSWHLRGCPFDTCTCMDMNLVIGKKTITGSPCGILVIQLGDIGDVVLTFPCMRALREAYPQARIVVAVWDKASELLEDCPWVDQVLAVTKRSQSLWAEFRFQIDFFRNLRNLHCDLAIDLRSGTRGAIMAFLSGAGQRIGFYAADGKLWRNRLFTALLKRDYTPDLHVVDYLLCLLEAFGITAEQRTPELAVAADKQEKIRLLFEREGIPLDKKIVAVQPFSLWQYKEWGKEKYIALIQWLVTEYGVAVIVAGSAAERDRAEEIVRSCGAGCYNLAGKTSLATYAALLQKCRFFIGVDSAGLHIAAAVGTATVGIFGPSSPESWAPMGRNHLILQKKMPCIPCRQKGCGNSEKSKCLDELAQEEVKTLIGSHLRTNPAIMLS